MGVMLAGQKTEPVGRTYRLEGKLEQNVSCLLWPRSTRRPRQFVFIVVGLDNFAGPERGGVREGRL